MAESVLVCQHMFAACKVPYARTSWELIDSTARVNRNFDSKQDAAHSCVHDVYTVSSEVVSDSVRLAQSNVPI